MFFIESSEECICPECGGKLKYRDKVERIQRYESGEKRIYMVNRLKCEKCGKMHRQLTDKMVKFKHYAAEVIEDVIDEVISEEDGLTHPCEGTMRLWRLWFLYNREQMEGQIRAAGHRLLGFADGFLKPEEPLLDGIRERVSPGWLGMVCRFVNNAGGIIRPLPA